MSERPIFKSDARLPMDLTLGLGNHHEGRAVGNARFDTFSYVRMDSGDPRMDAMAIIEAGIDDEIRMRNGGKRPQAEVKPSPGTTRQDEITDPLAILDAGIEADIRRRNQGRNG